MRLCSPCTGAVLSPDTPHSLAAEAERWPVIDGIPYLRTGRETLVSEVLVRLDAGDFDDALILLLADQDDWWTGPVTSPDDLSQLVAERDRLTLRDAMALLSLGPVADYFAYRWSDPTYLAGLALLDAHWNAPQSAFELACGIGHYLRDMTRRGVACTGADVVFAKCWLAKNWVAPDADYIVFDAASSWPVEDARWDLIMCHDAFYFLPDQHQIAERLRAAAGDKGMVAISHLHNAAYHAGAGGPAQPAEVWESLFADALVYDENALLEALMWGDVPPPSDWQSDPGIEAWSIVLGALPPQEVGRHVALPPLDAQLRRNPLLGDADAADVRWPSERYRSEYGGRCYWAMPDSALPFIPDPVRIRRLVDLPDRW